MIVYIPDVRNMEHKEAFHFESQTIFFILPQTEAALGTNICHNWCHIKVTGASWHFWFILIVKAMFRINLL